MTFGTVFDVKRFALHDGDGVRTTLFLKGCPLTCPWCQNPEGLDIRVRLQWSPSKCIKCGTCVEVCPMGALSQMTPTRHILIDHGNCEQSGVCIAECPTGALSFDGWRVSAEEIAGELMKDADFFVESDGGITLSGGEPLTQPDFAREVLGRCRLQGFSTAVETTLAVKSPVVMSFLDVTDRFLVDLKIADDQKHREILSADPVQIRRNLELLLSNGADVLIRIPLIPGYTATTENIKGLGDYIATLGPNQPPVELLNFNPLAENKYLIMKKPWPLPMDARRFSVDEIEGFAALLHQSGVERIIK